MRLSAIGCVIFVCWISQSVWGIVPLESLGQSSRKTGLVISELMYHPIAGSNDLEFVEVFNSQAIAEDLSGFRITGAVEYTFPSNSVLGARGFLVVAANPARLQSVYGIAGVLGPYAGRLQNSSGSVRLRNQSGAVLLDVPYSGKPPWPAAADGTGHSLILARPSQGEGSSEAWAASNQIGGSPGNVEPTLVDPLNGVMINEFLAHTDLPEVDYVELYNSGSQSVDLQGCIITDDPTTNRFQVTNSLILAPGGFHAFTENELGFRLDAAGERIFLFNATRSRILDAISFGPQENGIARGRWPDGASEFYRLESTTPGMRNAPILVSKIVLNEIMYNPISGRDDDEYVELYNRGSLPANLSGWKLGAGIEFTFPSNTVLAADGYLVVAHNAAHLMTNHPGLTMANTLGDFKGTLSNQGERITLLVPDDLVSTNAAGQAVTNRIDMVADEVTYRQGGRWGKWSDGGGSSLELIDPVSNKRLPSNWADSDESMKAPWTSLSLTGRLDNGVANFGLNNLQVLLAEAGECLIDNVEVVGPNGTNLVANSDFENGLSGWALRGTHETSAVADEGYASSHSLYLRASGKGDTGPNQARAVLLSSLANNQVATIRAKVRWLRGRPEILFRTEGNYLEAAAPLFTSTTLGTPGARNSQFKPNAGPAIYETIHSPLLPQAGESIRITARAHDPQGVSAFVLNYRLDPSNALSSVTMRDDGLGGDTLAADGIYTATLAGWPSNTLIAFSLTAIDGLGASNRFPASIGQEALIRVGNAMPGGNFGSYRLWMTQSNISRWTARIKLSNALLDGTFVYGRDRVIYNAGAIYSGSPYHSPSFSGPTGSPCDYTFVMPEDDRLLGETDVHLAWPGNGGDDSSGQREQAAYWIAAQLGLPFNHRRFVHVYINGTRRSYIMEDTQRANSEVLQQWFPADSDGDLFKIAGWFEFDDSISSFNTVWATLQNFTTVDPLTGLRLKDTARYRWNWQKRVLQDSAHDYTNLFALVDAVNVTGAAYTAGVERLVDVDQWMRTFAVEHLFGNWDSYGNQNGQNMYAYKPKDGRWQLLIWDLDIALGGSADAATSSLFQVSDSLIGRMYSHPPFRRLYFSALQEAVNGPLLGTRFNPMVDAKYTAFQASGIAAGSPSAIKSYVASRRSSVVAQLAAVNFPFAITSNGGSEYSVTTNFITLAGTGPVSIRTIAVNGVAYKPTWTTLSNWVISLPLSSQSNLLSVQGINRFGKPVASASDIIPITFTGEPGLPSRDLHFTEIMYHPTNAAPDTEFIEIFNASSDFTFDLSGYRLNGLDFTFADGNYLAPRSFALVVKNRLAFETFYGSGLPVVGEFHGSFDRGGELIQLIRSAASDREEEIVAEVRYDDDAPWPTEADGGGASLQLIDDKTDNRLVANWGTDTAIASTPGRSNSLARSLQPFPRLWINELQPLNVGDARDRASDLDPWIELYNQSTNRIDLLGYFLSDSYTNLGRWAFPPGSALDPGEFRVVWLDGEPFESTGAEFHTSFRLRATNAVVVLSRDLGGQLQIVDYAGFGKVSPGRSLGSFPDGDPIRRGILHYPTPGRTNNNALLAAVKINEWMASNVSQLADPANNPAAYDDWIELYNTANTPADLTGYTLTDNLDQPRKFVIPSGRIIPPHGFLLVWADSETNQNGLNPDLHAGFKLSQSGEDIGLFDPDGREIDSLKFDRQFDNISQGRWRDGEDNGFYFMSNATPRSSNIFPVINTAPSLQAADQTVSELLPWTFSAVAFDPDVPPQKLAYTLRSGAPSGLTLNPTNGLLRWAPSEQQGGGDFSVVIDVVDNGVPPLSNSVSFHIFVDEMNAVPRLFPVSNLVSSNRALVAFTATAADTDVPAQNLSFSLDAGGPVGASIDSRTGQFSWIPAEMDAPALHMVTVRVSDDGAPVLTDAQNVTITLLGAPRIAALTVSPAEITIWVATAPGLTYRIDSSESLAPGEWVAEGPAFSGTGFQVPVTRTFSASARRFYRVVQLD